jgi:hypothetical protein
MTINQTASISISTKEDFEECIFTFVALSDYSECEPCGQISIVQRTDGTYLLTLVSQSVLSKQLLSKLFLDRIPSAKL